MTKTSRFMIAGSFAALHLVLIGCDIEPSEPELELEYDEGIDEPSAAASGGQVATQATEPRSSCTPLPPINPQLCAGEEEVSRPPTAGWCESEIRLTKARFSGQGVSEGRGELSFVATATSNSGVVTVSSPEKKYSPGETMRHDLSLGTYTVPAGGQKNVQVCVEFTEDDGGPVNGQDDVGSACKVVQLTCDPSIGQPTVTTHVGPAALCGPMQCNGSARATIEIMRTDADGDCVPNPKDFTPEPCDEADKGTEGVALLQYYHYENEPLADLMQSVVSDLTKHYGAYDHVALVADNDTANIWGTSGQAFRDADVVYEPTRDGVLLAMRDLTAAGYRFDWFGFANGYPDGPFEAEFAVVSGDRISGSWLISATDPTLIGTFRGTIPIIVQWSTTGYASRLNYAFDTLGALASSGAFGMYFWPTTWIPFWDAWVAGEKYEDAVDDSVTSAIRTLTDAYLLSQSLSAPYWCVTSVLGQTPCAEDFFNDDVGPHEAMYNLEEIYDHAKTGGENVDISSERSYYGIKTVRFGGLGYSWP